MPSSTMYTLFQKQGGKYARQRRGAAYCWIGRNSTVFCVWLKACIPGGHLACTTFQKLVCTQYTRPKSSIVFLCMHIHIAIKWDLLQMLLPTLI